MATADIVAFTHLSKSLTSKITDFKLVVTFRIKTSRYSLIQAELCSRTKDTKTPNNMGFQHAFTQKLCVGFACVCRLSLTCTARDVKMSKKK